MPALFSPRRALGRTGFVATALGIGDLADRSVPLEQCVATVRRAMDAGLNLIDTAPGYESGYSEQIVGAALAMGGRDRMFVIDKIDHHDQPVAPQVEGSLRLLRMEFADAFVFHGCSTLEGWRMLAGEPMAELDRLRRQGKLRFRGISSHSPDVLAEAVASGLCDIVMFPVGPYVQPRYISQILPMARAAGVGTVCFKTFGAGKLLGDTAGYGRPLASRPRGKLSSGGADDAAPTLPCLSVADCIRHTLTCDPDVALLGLSFANEQDAAFAAAASFTPASDAELARIHQAAVAAIAGKGPCWWNPDGK
jgi:aryl-alcohol dehydrogenase-like predicted oxidoreductase